ncbi:MAG: hypothetical protein J07AB43_14060 [Candidatus Nanosalina sp. J07AB43]|nr:MAG: hypothetical protein J07AB43_14060 [Candidatus Nanosalina sp. J07AB43]
MDKKVCLIHWCTGTGHAARMIPVAKELESRNVQVSVAGGGFGSKFLEMNGFQEPGFEEVPDVAKYSKIELLPKLVTQFIPSALKRTVQSYDWIKQEDPDEIVTDDIFAMIACVASRRSFYRIDHLTPDILPFKWSIPQKLYNKVSMVFGENIIVTSVWPEKSKDNYIEFVGPLGQEGESGEVEDYDMLVVPGSWGGNQFDEISRRLREKGYDIKVVGGENWETKASMTPHMAAADCVICTGYSSIADAAVAGTTCVVYPFIPFQKAIANEIDDRDIEGIRTADSVDKALSTAEKCVEADCSKPDFENGSKEFVDAVL